jgi:hypothetical protein
MAAQVGRTQPVARNRFADFAPRLWPRKSAARSLSREIASPISRRDYGRASRP